MLDNHLVHHHQLPGANKINLPALLFFADVFHGQLPTMTGQLPLVPRQLLSCCQGYWTCLRYFNKSDKMILRRWTMDMTLCPMSRNFFIVVEIWKVKLHPIFLFSKDHFILKKTDNKLTISIEELGLNISNLRGDLYFGNFPIK